MAIFKDFKGTGKRDNDMKLGVIGGLGPAATAYFMELIIGMTKAERDQEHLEMIIYNCSKIPDRTQYILGHSKDNPLVPMVDIGKKLVEQGVGCIAIPCVTAHNFYDELTSSIDVPIINAVKETVKVLKKSGVSRAGIMATDGTMATGLIQRELESMGISSIAPSDKSQGDIMDIIYKDIKAGQPVKIDRFYGAAGELKQRGAQAIILGCTELSLLKRDYPIGTGFIDVMEVLSKASILYCGGQIKKEFDVLITGEEKGYADQRTGVS